MSEISLILLAAGSSSRFGLGTKKQWLRCGDEPLWLFVAKQFEKISEFREIIVVGDESELGYMQNFADYIFVLRDGQLLKSGDKKEVFSDFEFLKNANLDVPVVLKMYSHLKDSINTDFDTFLTGYNRFLEENF